MCAPVSYTHLDVYKRQVHMCWLTIIIVGSCWLLVLQIGFIVCDCGVCVNFLCIFDVECFEYCVMFSIDLYLFWY